MVAVIVLNDSLPLRYRNCCPAGKSRTPPSASRTRSATLAVGKRIEEEIRGEIDHPRVVPEPAERMVVGIDGAFVKAGHTRAGQRHQFEILTGRVEASQRGGEAFAVVRDLDPYAKKRVQAILRRCGRGQGTDLRILSDGVEMAEFGMTRVRIGLFQHALAHPEANSERFESIEAKLDELRSYLYANRESVMGYAEAYRNGERISSAHVESTVNQLINWRMCKKHQMGWSRAGAQQLLHVKTAIINGRLDQYTGVLVQIFLSVCFCRANDFADFRPPRPWSTFPER